MTIHHKSSHQKQFQSRLNHLAAFQGIPNWTFDQHSAVSHQDSGDRLINRKNGMTRIINAIKKTMGRLQLRIIERRQFRQNIQELRQLNDHTLRDIGLHRGDIAAIMTKSLSIGELNQQRKNLARPACEIIELEPPKVRKMAPEYSQLVDNAA